MRPRAWPEGPAKRGSGSGGDAGPRQNACVAPTARYGVASSSGRHCFALRGLARLYRNLKDGALRAVCLVRLLAKDLFRRSFNTT